MKNFEERLRDTELPKTAKILLPESLSAETKRRLTQRPDMEEIIKEAIEKIEQGSVESLETLIKRAL